MYKDASVQMETVFGDGSHGSSSGGFMDKLLGAGKRLITGESLFITVFTHRGNGKARAAFGAPYPGSIIPVDLKSVGGVLVCQKDSFLCAAKGVSIGIYFQRKILTGLFGGEGFIMQKLEGDGLVFVHAGGCVVERELGPGETLHVDTGCIVAMQPSINFDIQQVGGIKSALFGGEGLFFATLSGPGKVWLQSLPFSRLAGRMLQAAPQGGGKRTGEGSILGGLGDLLDGDN
ncbi:MAG: AIM24 family protein, partial [Acidobacteriota bacterium]